MATFDYERERRQWAREAFGRWTLKSVAQAAGVKLRTLRSFMGRGLGPRMRRTEHQYAGGREKTSIKLLPREKICRQLRTIRASLRRMFYAHGC